MTPPPSGFRISGATGIHRGDRPYQQDQVLLIKHRHVPSCVLGVVADGMGGKSGGRKAADQVLLTAQQLFESFAPAIEDPAQLLLQVISESHLMIRLTAISTEEEPHSTVAAFLMHGRRCDWIHSGDSRIYHFRGEKLLQRTSDQSYVQRLIDMGQLTEAEAHTHPQSNLLTGCLGTASEPKPVQTRIDDLTLGDCVMACSDGLWHYFTETELSGVLHSLEPREAAEFLISKARLRARGSGDNLSLVVIKLDALV
ncbi:PP2C family protein-serine/threonine phosphatase [Roseateles sp. BYS180W]|uniref:PP2C family protein-serine/threonine phosphatase n=1 Tax=Roseateles rivi TaxID=3299028 RepID=A0ABW7FVV0_9BURK